MELPFRQPVSHPAHPLLLRFNPCFNGIAFSTSAIDSEYGNVYGFNPCFNGIAFST